ncbi:hypothetical protein IWT140_01751 [Secundilactobacillus pentosiphilus]|uniref:Uncharacterized protein n=1 Tax=Secundilactobacillus pentosiphilus TaxID=1714682 RepID=A0A1Z5IQR6_9LACO|nr:hypothetical protein [Secundilactobacillus pentosiphilus]GAX04114.1 hypothetical protein IWT140_01751 [Secundilactobacillus pentosiphilus]
MTKFQTETNPVIKLHQVMLKAHQGTAKYMSIFTKVDQDGELVITNEQTLINVFQAIDKEKAALLNASKTLSIKEAI